MMTTDDEVAALKARVAELERKRKSPAPFVPEPWQRFDPTANMSMPRSATLDMANAVSTEMLRGIAHDNRAPTGPSSAGAIPSSQQISNVRGSGWAREVPIGPPPRVAQADRIVDEFDRRDRAELAQRLGKR